jgi:hypothetical protein
VIEQLQLFTPTPPRSDTPLGERRAWLHPDGSYRSWDGDLFPGLDRIDEDRRHRTEEAA